MPAPAVAVGVAAASTAMRIAAKRVAKKHARRVSARIYQQLVGRSTDPAVKWASRTVADDMAQYYFASHKADMLMAGSMATQIASVGVAVTSNPHTTAKVMGMPIAIAQEVLTDSRADWYHDF
jgi:hypothetical protein